MHNGKSVSQSPHTQAVDVQKATLSRSNASGNVQDNEVRRGDGKRV